MQLSKSFVKRLRKKLNKKRIRQKKRKNNKQENQVDEKPVDEKPVDEKSNKTIWCLHPDCLESLEVFQTYEELELHMKEFH